MSYVIGLCTVAATLLIRQPINQSCIIQIVTDIEVTIENYFPAAGNISRGRRPREIFPTKGK